MYTYISSQRQYLLLYMIIGCVEHNSFKKTESIVF